MARPGSSRFRRTSGPSRQSTWDDGPEALETGISANGSAIFSTGFQAALPGLTIVRLRGVFSMWLTSAGSAFDGFGRVAIGFGVVSENAAGIGITAVPLPIDDISWDGWLYHADLGTITTDNTSPVLRGPLPSQRHIVDSKAMRKFKESDVLVGVLQANSEMGAAAFSFTSNSRVLVKLA